MALAELARTHNAQQTDITFEKAPQLSLPPGQLPGARNIYRLVNVAAEALSRGEIDHFVQIYNQLGIAPPPEPLLRFAEATLSRGVLGDALYAYHVLGIPPDAEYLALCAQEAARRGDASTAARASFLVHRLDAENVDEIHGRIDGLIGKIRAYFSR
jgi:hypothetical protein